uniref:GM01870p n=1 Tax=Drosophila melanogaster TaxID=7227 RepID=Q95SE2_DROME|nr:GM01870p [Drosophila melanogaster]
MALDVNSENRHNFYMVTLRGTLRQRVVYVTVVPDSLAALHANIGTK